MGNPKTFFIVDDDEDDLFFFEQALNRADKSVQLIKVPKSVDALKKLKSIEKRPDYIFLDLNMPQKSGKECLAEIRREEKLNDVPVIIYTTSSSDSDRTDILQMGANHFLTKFSDFGQLCRTLAALIHNELTLEHPVTRLLKM